MNGRARAGVEIWIWPLDASADEIEALSCLLSLDERARSERFHHPRDRGRWIVARGRMRQTLGKVTNRAPTDLVFSTETHGRPFLDGVAPSFNLSHADGIGALAVSFDARVGLDVEAIRPMAREEMHWPLSVAERQALDALEGSARDESFYRFWTLKEAFIKGLGIGVSLPGEDFDMSPSHLGEPRLLRLAGAPGEPARWRFAEFVPARGYRAAVAALTEGRDLVANWHASCLTRAI